MEFTERLKAYFEALDENATWDSVKPLFDDMMHQDLKVVTADGVLTKNQWEQAVKGLVAQGAKSSDIEISSDQDDTVYYRLTVTMGNGTTMQPSSKGTIKDGQIIRVEPVDPEVYSNLTKLAAG